ncbi:hypothetical protein [Blastopirellula retiformator]|nr:hypothetical protein [Blastopirellula retiformator]
MEMVMRVVRKKGYHIPQRAFDLVINVPMDIAEDKLKDSEGGHVPVEVQHRLRALNLLRMVVKDAQEIELIDAELELLRKESKPEVFVREDEEFFGNEAHAKAERESEGSVQSEEPAAGDRAAESPTAPEGGSPGSAPA